MRTRILGAWLVGALPLAVSAQTTPTQANQGAAQVGGVSTVDYVNLRAGNIGTPLRFGSVVPGSEQIQLGGRILKSGTDYGMDYDSGMVYLKVAPRSGEQLVASYRYDPKGKPTGASGFAGINSFSGLSLAPGLGLVGGLGLAERAADGTVMSNNVFGWNNTLKFGPEGKSSLGGLFLYSDRQKNETQAGLSMDANAKPGEATKEEGTSQFLLQNFRSSLFGGTVSADYQDISKNFASAGQVRSAGYSAADVDRLMKERGLKRQGASVSGMKFGSGPIIGASFRGVEDEKGKGVDWSSYNLQQGGFKFGYATQRVDEKFTRFGDLSEAERDQLAKEAGLSRKNLSTEFAQKTGKLSFSSSEIVDDKTEKSAIRREARLDAGKIGMRFGEQKVDKAFSRVGSLTGDEQGQMGREVGAQRQWAGLTAALGGKTTPQNFSFDQVEVKTEAGRFSMRDATFASKNFSLDHISMGAQGKTLPMNTLGDAESKAYTKRIGEFFNTPATNDAQRAAFLGAGDVKRDLTRMTATIGKDGKLVADQLKFGEGEKGGVAQSAAFESGKVKASYRKQEFGDKFADAARLLDFEKARLGSVAGLQRTDVSFGLTVDKSRSFNFGQMKADDGKGDVSRTALAVTGKGLSIVAAERKVDKNFANASGLIDAEKGLLDQFRGFQERDLGLNYTGTKGVKVAMFVQQADNDDTKESRSVVNGDVQWQITRGTDLQYVTQESSNKDKLTSLFSRSLHRMAVTQRFGALATFKMIDERVENEGKNNPNPDVHKQYIALEANLDKKTSLKTERTMTDLSNGDKENIAAHTVSTALTKNVGVSVTDVATDRQGDDKDERKRAYGFYYDFGKGLRLNYGYNKSLVGDVTGNGVETLTFGQAPGTLAPNQMSNVGAGDIGGILVGGGIGTAQAYSSDANAAHTQAFTNVGISTAKPFQFGDFRDLKISFALDRATDYSQFLRENQSAGLSGRLGSNLFAFAYRGQLTNPVANPNATSDVDARSAIDRSVSLTTDPNPKATFVVNGSIKVRDLPGDDDYTSRNFGLTARPIPGVEVTNQVQTNLEVANPNVILGSSLLADRANRWALGVKASADTTLGASWEEKVNDATDASSTYSSLNLTLFQKSGSPLKLTYGMDQIEGNLVKRQVTRYSLQYDAKASAAQTFSLFLGNVGYIYNLEDDLKGMNWTLRMNYQLRF